MRRQASPAGGARSKAESRTAATDSAQSAEPSVPARRRPRGARPGAKASIHTPPPAEPRRRRSLPGARPPAAGSWQTAGRKDGPTDTPPLPLGLSAGGVLAWELAWECRGGRGCRSARGSFAFEATAPLREPARTEVACQRFQS